MSVQIQPLFEPAVLTSGISTLFTAGSATRVDKLTVYNSDTVTHYVTAFWVPSGGAAMTGNTVCNNVPVSPGQSLDLWPFMGHTLAAGDAIAATADAGGFVVILGSGLIVG